MKKISIIIPAFGTEKYIERCLNSVIGQTYPNLEIIVVNDCSPGNMKQILDKYSSLDSRIKIVEHEKNKGLFQARLTGSDVATGDYICFLDSDDYITRDYYRILVNSIEKNNSDFAVSTIVNEEAEDRRYVYKLFESDRQILENESILNEFFSQKGLNYSWHVVWNKLYTMDLWKKCREYYSKINSHLIMTEDVAYSTILYTKANKISYTKNAYYFYCANDEASTSITSMTMKKIEKSINDIITSFSFVEKYLKTEKYYEKYKEEFEYWKKLYLKMWYDRLNEYKVKNEEEILKKQDLLNRVDSFVENIAEEDLGDIHRFYRIRAKFNDGLEKIKEEIVNPIHQIISFDIFDTLIIRPFYEPSDMFYLLNKKFNEEFKVSGFMWFSKIRKDSEAACREYMWKDYNYNEITLDEIYEYMANNYKLDSNKLNKIKDYEKELELQYCVKRNTGYELYELAKFLDKKVVYTSDMYLDKDLISKILSKNNYENDNIYISSESRKTKSNGELYKLVLNSEKIHKQNILHIGDNYESDYLKAKSVSIDSCHLPKSIDIFNNKFNSKIFSGALFANLSSKNIDHHNYLEYMGNRISLALVANKFFDNPYTSIIDGTNFSSSPQFIGYYALGMHMFAVAKWLMDNTKEYDTVSFMARDGKLLLDVCNELKNIYDNKNKFEYIYVSRKSLMPLMIFDEINIYKVLDYIRYDTSTPEDILKLLKPIINVPSNYKMEIREIGFMCSEFFESRNELQRFINFIKDNYFDLKKYNAYFKMVSEYFKNQLKGKVANFDVGYSGQPEFILGKLCDKQIDTFFIHTNNDTGFINSKTSNYKLNCFYQFRPVFTGTLREYLMSENIPSCIGYDKKDNDVVPIFNDISKSDYYNDEILRIIQSSAVEFTKDITGIFGKEIFNIDIENYYMSIPFEFFLHNSNHQDRMIFENLEFDENVGEKFNMIDFWSKILNQNGLKNATNDSFTYAINNDNFIQSFYEYRVKNRNIFVKIIYYLFFDRVNLRHKLVDKFGKNNIFIRILRKIYHLIKKIKNGRKGN